MRSSPFCVSVTDLVRAPGNRKRVQAAGRIADLSVTSARVVPGSDVGVEAVLDAMSEDAILATGTVTATWEGECRRCLGPATGTITVEVRDIFDATGDTEETYPLRGDQVDLEPLARDAVMLELPQAPLCSEECAGLCEMCGANRNDSDCGHRPDTTDPRWAALDELRSETTE
ncbi:MAG: hypothetical protein QOG03_1414 [Actinomycetota bacterium]|nr:hypothetical protein [Actinomycetota bacterium]